MSKPSRKPGEKTKTVGPSSPVTARAKASVVFPIVGIGASAGGLEALESFLGHVPAESGMAFVIVQHLDPTHQGIMPELLQRSTKMTVVQVKDRMKVEPNRVYVIPPNKDMSLLHGVLHLFVPASPRGLRLPIDFFFRSLAADQQERSIGLILSGMGTDGTLGIKAIKDVSGLVLVQNPEEAKFDGMPRSAIDTALVDVVALASELCGRIIACLDRAPQLPPNTQILESKAQSALEKAIILLREHTRHDFSLYKKSTLYRRIERRMGVHQIDKIAHYVRFLQENLQERDLLFKELLIGVTSFFRDPEAWERLKTEIIPALFADRPEGGAIRAWTPGCSTGEEAYSLAILLKEAVEQVKPNQRFTFQIFATDLDQDAIGKARQGHYPANIAADVTAERLRRFFTKEGGDKAAILADGFRAAREIREMVTFAMQDVLLDPPFTKLDILVCRNLLIYLDPAAQKKILPLFHYSLRPDGVLFLGSAETIGGSADLFASVDRKWRIFRRKECAGRVGLDFPATLFPVAARAAPEAKQVKPDPNLQSLADQLLLQRFSPAAVLVNDAGDILYISGRTGKYLEPAVGKANWNIFAMAREGLRHEVASALHQASQTKDAVTVNGLTVKTNDHYQQVNLTVQAIDDPSVLRGMFFVVFSDAPPTAAPLEEHAQGRAAKAPGRRAPSAATERELERLGEELRMTREEMQTSQEELKSANEELQSANEELQSTNEELMTSKEEMQSLNEELQTINAELQSKMDDLSRVNNDMANLLNSTEIATVFLDEDLNVRRFTPQATRIIKLIAGDVGRPITDIGSDLVYHELAEDVQEVLRTLVFVEKQAVTRDGRWYTVRIIPYRTLDNVINGVVITFVDITASKTLEAELRQLSAAKPENQEAAP